jgi:hypothetical protein
MKNDNLVWSLSDKLRDHGTLSSKLAAAAIARGELPRAAGFREEVQWFRELARDVEARTPLNRYDCITLMEAAVRGYTENIGPSKRSFEVFWVLLNEAVLTMPAKPLSEIWVAEDLFGKEL